VVTGYHGVSDPVNPTGEPHAPASDSALPTALAHAALGVAVLPVKARGKAPLTRHGVDDATTDEETIRQWARRWPGCNWGARCDADRIVIDADKPEALDLIRALDLPEAPTVYTARGRHLVYRYSGELPAKLRNEAGDVVGDVKRNGYVLLPGSIHPSGKMYRVGPGYSAFGPELPERCARLLRELDQGTRPELPPMPEGDTPEEWKAYGVTLLSALAADVSNTPEGGRNDALNWATFRLAQHSASCGIARDTARTAIVAAAKSTGLPKREIARTFAGSWAAGIAQPVAPKARRDVSAEVEAARAFVSSHTFAKALGRAWRSCRTVTVKMLDVAEQRGSLTIAPGVDHLVILTGLPERTVRRALARMAEAELIAQVEVGGFRQDKRGRLRGYATRWALNGLSDQLTTLQTISCTPDRAVTYSERVGAPGPAECDAAVHPMSVAFGGPVAEAWSALERPEAAARGQLGADVVEALARRGEATATELAEDVGCEPRTARKHLSTNEAVEVAGQRKTGGRPVTVYRLSLPREEALGIEGPVCKALAAKRRKEGERRRAALRSRIRRGLKITDPEADAFAKAEREFGERWRRLRDIVFTTEPEPSEWESWRFPPELGEAV